MVDHDRADMIVRLVATVELMIFTLIRKLTLRDHRLGDLGYDIFFELLRQLRMLCKPYTNSNND